MSYRPRYALRIAVLIMRCSAACSQSVGGGGGMFTVAVVRHRKRPHHQPRNGKSEGRLATQCPRPARAFVVSLVVVGEEVAQVPRSGPSPNLPCKGLRMQGQAEARSAVLSVDHFAPCRTDSRTVLRCRIGPNIERAIAARPAACPQSRCIFFSNGLVHRQ